MSQPWKDSFQHILVSNCTHAEECPAMKFAMWSYERQEAFSSEPVSETHCRICRCSNREPVPVEHTFICVPCGGDVEHIMVRR